MANKVACPLECKCTTPELFTTLEKAMVQIGIYSKGRTREEEKQYRTKKWKKEGKTGGFFVFWDFNPPWRDLYKEDHFVAETENDVAIQALEQLVNQVETLFPSLVELTVRTDSLRLHNWLLKKPGKLPITDDQWQKIRSLIERLEGSPFEVIEKKRKVVVNPSGKRRSTQIQVSGVIEPPPEITLGESIIFYTDGSYEPASKKAGFAVFAGFNYPWLMLNYSRDVDFSKVKSGTTELLADVAATRLGRWLSLKSVIIRSDYKNNEALLHEQKYFWVQHGWISSSGKAVQYKNLIKENTRMYTIREMSIAYEHVSAHEGFLGNEEADILAKNDPNHKPVTAAEQIMDVHISMCGLKHSKIEITDMMKYLSHVEEQFLNAENTNLIGSDEWRNLWTTQYKDRDPTNEQVWVEITGFYDTRKSHYKRSYEIKWSQNAAIKTIANIVYDSDSRFNNEQHYLEGLKHALIEARSNKLEKLDIYLNNKNLVDHINNKHNLWKDKKYKEKAIDGKYQTLNNCPLYQSIIYLLRRSFKQWTLIAPPFDRSTYAPTVDHPYQNDELMGIVLKSHHVEINKWKVAPKLLNELKADYTLHATTKSGSKKKIIRDYERNLLKAIGKTMKEMVRLRNDSSPLTVALYCLHSSYYAWKINHNLTMMEGRDFCENSFTGVKIFNGEEWRNIANHKKMLDPITFVAFDWNTLQNYRNGKIHADVLLHFEFGSSGEVPELLLQDVSNQIRNENLRAVVQNADNEDSVRLPRFRNTRNKYSFASSLLQVLHGCKLHEHVTSRNREIPDEILDEILVLYQRDGVANVLQLCTKVDGPFVSGKRDVTQWLEQLQEMSPYMNMLTTFEIRLTCVSCGNGKTESNNSIRAPLLKIHNNTLDDRHALYGPFRFPCAWCKLVQSHKAEVHIPQACRILTMILPVFEQQGDKRPMGFTLKEIPKRLMAFGNKWALGGMIEHAGTSTSADHYIAYRPKEDGSYWKCEDSTITTVQEDLSLKIYMLMYEKCY